MGLGLTNAQKSILSHNGKVEFHSAEKEGTTFKIYLPISNQTFSWEN
jgi:nitrogen-specific signal transduction histidine kinase